MIECRHSLGRWEAGRELGTATSCWAGISLDSWSLPGCLLSLFSHSGDVQTFFGHAFAGNLGVMFFGCR